MNRPDTLDMAKQYVTADRQADHGKPEDTFKRIAYLWNSYLGGNVGIQDYDVAAMLALLKIARIRANHLHEDNWVDLAGYASCGAELATEGGGADA